MTMAMAMAMAFAFASQFLLFLLASYRLHKLRTDVSPVVHH